MKLHLVDQSGPRVEEALFGMNFEITRRTAFGGFYAQLINNRKFFAVDQGVPCGFSFETGATLCMDRSRSRCNSHVVLLDNGSFYTDQPITLTGGKNYTLKIVCIASPEMILTVEVTMGDTHFIRHESVIGLQAITCPFIASPGTPTCCVRIRTQGQAEIHSLSLLPDDHVFGARREVADLLRDLHPYCLRFPGGCFTDHYNWREGLLPVDERSPIEGPDMPFLLENTYGQDCHEIGTDEFMGLCRYIGAKPEITVRMVNAPMSEAVDWLEYCNGSPDTPMGALRESRGLAPFGVEYWYIGNEIFSFGHEMAVDPHLAAEQTKAYIAAMRAVDPSIKVAVGTFAGQPWNDVYVPALAHVTDCFSHHFYLTCRFDENWGQVPSESVVNVLENAFLPPLRANKALIDMHSTGDKKPAVALDEWNYAWGLDGGNELFLCTALIYSYLCAHATDFNIVKGPYFHPVNEGMIRVTSHGAQLVSAGHVHQIFRCHAGRRLWYTGEKNDIYTVATEQEDGMYVTLVNCSLTETKTVSLRMDHPISDARMEQYVPDRLDSHSDRLTVVQEVCVSPTRDSADVTLPPFSLTAVHMRFA